MEDQKVFLLKKYNIKNNMPKTNSYYLKKAQELNDIGVVVIKHDWFIKNNS